MKKPYENCLSSGVVRTMTNLLHQQPTPGFFSRLGTQAGWLSNFRPDTYYGGEELPPGFPTRPSSRGVTSPGTRRPMSCSRRVIRSHVKSPIPRLRQHPCRVENFNPNQTLHSSTPLLNVYMALMYVKTCHRLCFPSITLTISLTIFFVFRA